MRVNQQLSDPYEATSGVPQGSQLGPVLFLFYVQDLVSKLTVDRSLYADDLKLSRTIASSSDAHLLQADLDIVAQWDTLNSLHLNLSKYQVITFSRRRSGDGDQRSYTLAKPS